VHDSVASGGQCSVKANFSHRMTSPQNTKWFSRITTQMAFLQQPVGKSNGLAFVARLELLSCSNEPWKNTVITGAKPRRWIRVHLWLSLAFYYSCAGTSRIAR